MNIRHLFLSTLNILIFFLIFYQIFKINYIFREDIVFGSQLFSTDLVKSQLFSTVMDVTDAFSAFAKFTIIIMISVFIVAWFNMVMNKYKNICSGLSKQQVFIIILGISFLLKLILLGFTIHPHDDVKDMVDLLFVNGEFKEYKLYNYIAYAVYLLTDNYNYYLYILNIIFGSITMGVLYLIFSRFVERDLSLFIIMSLTLLCLPLTSIAAYLRVDAMYILLYISTFYYLIKLIQDNNNHDFIKLLLVLSLSCLCRESTLYMLPLFIFILLFSKYNKIKYILISTLTVFIISTLISSLNLKNHGMKSKYKEFHLLVHAMKYGYLNEDNIAIYQDNLSDDAKLLLEDINKSYKIFVPPYKREKFYPIHHDLGLGESVQVFWFSGHWALFRPDVQNIEAKSRATSYKGNLEMVTRDHIKVLEQQSSILTKKRLSELMAGQSLKYDDTDDKELSKYLHTLLQGLFLAEKNNLSGAQGLCGTSNEAKLHLEYQTNCVINVLKSIDASWLRSYADNSPYFRAALPYVWTFDQQNRVYKQHPKIKNISEIILQMPMLYVTQSLLTLTTMSGYHPNPSGLIEKSGVYESSFLPDLFLITFQRYYGFIINFWYIFCSYVFLHSLFNRHVNSRNLKIIVSIIPLYYGAFTSFATFSEFYRHMIVVIPLILYNYIIVLNILRDSFKNILVICFQPKKIS
tara:strand:- start:1050 stop:3116 length:2067 start_codon:yes stop_codon:yes gene_type:complete